ncbi:tol-pal system protein YbgF [Camelimonas abortus]|uniref:Cell division coordinator CpoB n=1 Tax=Camelimonas abortus TaxID=1017184 RepID=A0ABV7LDT6_9HYPH
MKPDIRFARAWAVAVMAMATVAPARAQDAADLVVRVTQLEEQVRSLSGKVEQLQFENRRLAEQLRKFQQDVDFRLQEGRGGGAPPQAAAAAPRGADPAQAPAASAGDGFERGRSQIQQGDYAGAEMSLRQFLNASPKDRRAAEAIYWLGESYYQRQRYSEAAEQFLKITTDYPKAARGPDALLKLGMSLARLDAKPEACATLAEVLRKYPNASAEVRAAVERERRRSKC